MDKPNLFTNFKHQRLDLHDRSLW